MAGQASALEQGCVCAWYSSKRRLKLLDHGNSLPERLHLTLLEELVLSGWRWCSRLACVTWLLSVFLHLPTNQCWEEADSLSPSTPVLLLQWVLFRCCSQHQQTSTPLGTLSSLVALSVIRCCCDACRVLPEGRWGKGELCCKQLRYRRIVICGGCILLFFESSFLSVPVLSLYSELRGYRSRGGDKAT